MNVGESEGEGEGEQSKVKSTTVLDWKEKRTHLQRRAYSIFYNDQRSTSNRQVVQPTQQDSTSPSQESGPNDTRDASTAPHQEKETALTRPQVRTTGVHPPRPNGPLTQRRKAGSSAHSSREASSRNECTTIQGECE